MYYHSSEHSGRRSQSGVGLPMTPSVALRALYEQLFSFKAMADRGIQVDLFVHFVGPIEPPVKGGSRPMGDPVFDAIADYASKVVARAGLLTHGLSITDRDRLEDYGRMTHFMFTAEHALAVDLGRITPRVPLRRREFSARAVLALGAYWCDRNYLLGIDAATGAGLLLGSRPDDAKGKVLFEHARSALEPPRKPSAGGGLGSDGPDIGIGIGIGIPTA